MRGKGLRSAERKKRARAKFWDRYGERLRLALIGGGAFIAATCIAEFALR